MTPVMSSKGLNIVHQVQTGANIYPEAFPAYEPPFHLSLSTFGLVGANKYV